jgi:TPR repeat protein
MGKIGNRQSKTIFKCLNNKPNFSKSFSMLTKRPTTSSSSTYQSKISHNFNSSYPAIYYLYGLGNVKQDYNIAYELFSYSENNYGIPDQAYLAYMNFMGMGVEQNPNKGKGLAIELAKNIPITKTQKNSWGQTLLCGDVSYNFIISDLLNSESYWMKKNYSQLSKYNKKKLSKEHDANEKIDKKVRKKYRDKLGQCLFESEPEVSIKFLKDYIYNRMNDWFKNPELVKTLNYLGEPK